MHLVSWLLSLCNFNQADCEHRVDFEERQGLATDIQNLNKVNHLIKVKTTITKTNT